MRFLFIFDRLGKLDRFKNNNKFKNKMNKNVKETYIRS